MSHPTCKSSNSFTLAATEVPLSSIGVLCTLAACTHLLLSGPVCL